MKRKVQFEEGKIYHIYNRGVAKCKICEGENDFWRIMQGFCLFNNQNSTNNILWQLERDRGRLSMNVLKDFVENPIYKRKPLVKIIAYCAMPNHFHLIVKEIEGGGIVKFMQKFGTGYACYFNKKHNRVGSLFQGRFRAVLVENEKQLLYLLTYVNVINSGQLIEPNLKELGVKDIQKTLRAAEEWPFGTHREYMGIRGSIIIDKDILAELLPTPKDYLNLARNVLLDKKYTEIGNLFLE